MYKIYYREINAHTEKVVGSTNINASNVVLYRALFFSIHNSIKYLTQNLIHNLHDATVKL